MWEQDGGEWVLHLPPGSKVRQARIAPKMSFDKYGLVRSKRMHWCVILTAWAGTTIEWNDAFHSLNGAQDRVHEFLLGEK